MNTTTPTEDEMLYQARLQSLKERYEQNNSSTELYKGCALSNDEIKDFIRLRVKEAKWAKGGPQTMNDFDPLTWAALGLLAMAIGMTSFLMYLVIRAA